LIVPAAARVSLIIDGQLASMVEFGRSVVGNCLRSVGEVWGAWSA
jgi:hypothetical protein